MSTPRSRLRRVARRLPGLSSYERHIEALSADVQELQTRLQNRDVTPNGPLFVPTGHFYSPVVDVAEAARRADRIWGFDPADVPGVDLRIDQQWALFDSLLPLMSDLDFSRDEQQAKARGHRYWAPNFAYGDGDASVLGGLLRQLRPKRMIEFGCGFSSACTLDIRSRFLDGSPRLTFVDPFPELLEGLLTDADRATVDIRAVGTQDVGLDLVRELEAGDVLFIDSTHISKTGSDVNRIFFEILPALAPGVVVHLHDIFQGFEYPRPWVDEGRSWNEQYVLRAFLQYNQAFEIMLFPVLLQVLDLPRYTAGLPGLTNNGGSFWMRKVA